MYIHLNALIVEALKLGYEVTFTMVETPSPAPYDKAYFIAVRNVKGEVLGFPIIVPNLTDVVLESWLDDVEEAIKGG